MIRRLSRQMQWFRSSSYSPSESSLCDDYSSKTPDNAITHRTYGLFRHHTVPDEKQGGGDVTWVTEDFNADKNASYLPQTTIGPFISVRIGQQVEVIDYNLHSLPEFCLVRVIGTQDSNNSVGCEGIVPLYCLRLPSRSVAFSSKSASMETEDVTTACNESSPSFSTESTSSSTKRKGAFKKWLTNPVRKLSSGKIDKTSNNSNDSPKSGSKKTSHSVTPWKTNNSKEDTNSKILAKNDELIGLNKSSSASLPTTPSLVPQTSKSLDLNGCVVNVTEEDGDVTDVELPPPMKIQEHTYPAVSTLSANSTNVDITQNIENMISAVDLGTTDLDFIVKIESESCEELSKDDINNGLNEGKEIIDCSIDDTNDETDNSMTEGSEREKALFKRKYILHELVDTERDYVFNLGLVVDGYLELMRNECEIPVPEDLKNGKDKIIFGNIEAIYEWHRDSFLAEIDKCLEEPERLGLLFRRAERRLNMYVVYCQNKPKSEHIVSEYLDTFFEEIRQKLGHKLQLPDLLIKPVQRIMKYQLLLKDMLKCTERAGLTKEAEDLKKAVHIMHVVPKAANDMMCVGRLQHFDGKITAQGKLLQQGLLYMGELGSVGSGTSISNNSNIGSTKLKERQVFLFEQIIIFSETVGQKGPFSNPIYLYKAHLMVNKMCLIDKVDESDPTKFLLKSKDPNMSEIAFLCQGPNKEVTDIWVSNIRAILDTQLDFLRALQSPIAYQKELTKEDSAPELGSLWNPSLRKTLSHPAAVHREKNSKSATKEPTLGTTNTSKSMRQSNKTKTKTTFLSVNNECESVESVSESCGSGDQSNRKYSCPSDKPPTHSQKHQSSSPSKSKRTFLEGFKNPLRQKRTETTVIVTSESTVSCNLLSSHSLDSSTGAQTRSKLEAQTKDSSVIRRWSESATPLISTSTSQTISNTINLQSNNKTDNNVNTNNNNDNNSSDVSKQ